MAIRARPAQLRTPAPVQRWQAEQARRAAKQSGPRPAVARRSRIAHMINGPAYAGMLACPPGSRCTWLMTRPA
jgi:hypothetical protein